ncbi:hypothetical protein BDR06DRAFT_1013955 [Suillus hirtellus]|nr:hypothetical protein BDR06DRAFT_1013955 [Suillus hirtellus]
MDHVYRPWTVWAIVAPNLCTPLLLGGPFLQHNRIVVDHELHTCIAKDVNYNLLQPIVVPPIQSQMKGLWGPDLLWAKRNVVSKLKAVLPEWKDIIDDECKLVKGIDIVTAIQAHINNLVYKGELKALDAKYKSKFEDWFPVDIPHNDTMLSDVLFCLNLKDANKVVQLQSYDCPKKYRAAWKTLLDSHIESRRLRHLDSEWSSPSFIIPKPDPMVLLRWVNDFW